MMRYLAFGVFVALAIVAAVMIVGHLIGVGYHHCGDIVGQQVVVCTGPAV